MSIEEKYSRIKAEAREPVRKLTNVMELEAKNAELVTLLKKQQHEIAELWRRVIPQPSALREATGVTDADDEQSLAPTKDAEQDLSAMIVELDAFERHNDVAGRRAFLMQWKEEIERRAAEEASRDPLTGLPNRRTFMEDAGRMFVAVREFVEYSEYLKQNPNDKDRRVDEPSDQGDFSVLMLDLDHFKAINDTHGHSAGDEVLRGVAEVLLKCLRPTDVVARWGGEEFIIAFKSHNPDSRTIVAEKMRRAIESMTILHDGIRIPVTASIGAAKWSRGERMLDVIQSADANLYNAKDAGRNRISIDAV